MSKSNGDEMKRFAENELIAWKSRGGRKPLVVRGAMQMGKTHLVKAFGMNCLSRNDSDEATRDPHPGPLPAYRERVEEGRAMRSPNGVPLQSGRK